MKLIGRVSAFVCASALTFLAAGTASAQDRNVRLYAGYTFFHTDDGSLSGLRLSPEFKLNSFASVVGDFSGEKGTISGTDTTITTFLGGVRLRKGFGGSAIFVHGLAGGVRTSSTVNPFQSVNISVSDTGLGLDGGGGIEFNFRGAIKMRVGADYLRRKVDIGGGKTANENDIRATVGFVF